MTTDYKLYQLTNLISLVFCGTLIFFSSQLLLQLFYAVIVITSILRLTGKIKYQPKPVWVQLIVLGFFLFVLVFAFINPTNRNIQNKERVEKSKS